MMLQAEGESQFRSGNPFIVGNEKLKEVVETIVQLANDNVLYLAEDWDDYVDNAIGNDMVAGVYDGNWIISSIQQVKANSGKWEITYAPTFTGIPGYASNGGSSLCVTSNCKNSMLAKDFLAYTFGGGSAIDGSSITYDDALLNAGVVGSCVAAAGSDVYTQGVEYFNNQPIYATIVEYSQLVPSVEQSDYHYVCRKYMSQAVLDIIENGTDIDEALATAETEYKKETEPKY
jgi:lactose/L-arabinose transport system substrate-binding protein